MPSLSDDDGSSNWILLPRARRVTQRIELAKLKARLQKWLAAAIRRLETNYLRRLLPRNTHQHPRLFKNQSSCRVGRPIGDHCHSSRGGVTPRPVNGAPWGSLSSPGSAAAAAAGFAASSCFSPQLCAWCRCTRSDLNGTAEVRLFSSPRIGYHWTARNERPRQREPVRRSRTTMAASLDDRRRGHNRLAHIQNLAIACQLHQQRQQHLSAYPRGSLHLAMLTSRV